MYILAYSNLYFPFHYFFLIKFILFIQNFFFSNKKKTCGNLLILNINNNLDYYYQKNGRFVIDLYRYMSSKKNQEIHTYVFSKFNFFNNKKLNSLFFNYLEQG